MSATLGSPSLYPSHASAHAKGAFAASAILQRRTFGPSRTLCITAYHACDAIQITLHPSPRCSYFDGAQRERARPRQYGLCKGLVEGEGIGMSPSRSYFDGAQRERAQPCPKSSLDSGSGAGMTE